MSIPTFQFSSFDMKNLPQIIDTVLPLWKSPERDERFNRVNVEFVVRNNVVENDLTMQMTSQTTPDELCAVAFASRKSERSEGESWLSEHSKYACEDDRLCFNAEKDYVQKYDEETLSYMNEDDVKLNLLVSCKKGFGGMILTVFSKVLRGKGFKTMYLWTDTYCCWEWYASHGFELVKEECYEPFCSDDDDWKVYIYKKII